MSDKGGSGGLVFSLKTNLSQSTVTPLGSDKRQGSEGTSAVTMTLKHLLLGHTTTGLVKIGKECVSLR